MWSFPFFLRSILFHVLLFHLAMLDENIFEVGIIRKEMTLFVWVFFSISGDVRAVLEPLVNIR